MTVPVIMEINTYTGYKTRYNHPTTISLVDRKVNKVKNKNFGKFRKLDQIFAGDVIGDWRERYSFCVCVTCVFYDFLPGAPSS